MIVIDASSLAKYILKEDNWIELEEIIRNNNVYSIDLIAKEVLNTIWKHHIILNTISLKTALEKIEILNKMIKDKLLTLENEKEYYNEAIKIALKHKITVYDALYIAQAKKYNTTLVTSDKAQATIARRIKLKTRYIP